MRTDVNYSHSKNIGESTGDFCGVPILSYNNFDLELDVELDAQRTVLRNKALGCSDIPNTAEILPGEILCADNIIRRVTAAEAVGYDEFKEKNPVKMLVGLSDGRMYDSEENAWVTKDKKLRQSTPEEMCAWLNAMPKRSFKSVVKVDGDNKVLSTFDVKGNLLYSFEYFGGNPGTYIGGDETRLLSRPQSQSKPYSPTLVVQCYDNGNSINSKPVEFKEWPDEWACTYVPTSNVSRATIGGTALFDALKEAIELDKVAAEPEIKLAQPQICEWYPDGEVRCTFVVTHAATKHIAATCDRCYAAREAKNRRRPKSVI